MERGDTISSAKGKNAGLFESMVSDQKHIEAKLKVSSPSFCLKDFCSDSVLCGLCFWPLLPIWCLEV